MEILGRSLTGDPAQMTSTTGPMTTEGQKLWDMVMGQLQNTPATRKINFGGNNWTVQNPGYNSLLTALRGIDSSRRGTMQPFTPDQGGLLGTLAPILGAMAGSPSKNGLGGTLWDNLLSGYNNWSQGGYQDWGTGAGDTGLDIFGEGVF
jgi:hypothetical protein